MNLFWGGVICSYQCREEHLNDMRWNKFPEYTCDAAYTVNGSGSDCGAWILQQVLMYIENKKNILNRNNYCQVRLSVPTR